MATRPRINQTYNEDRRCNVLLRTEAHNVEVCAIRHHFGYAVVGGEARRSFSRTNGRIWRPNSTIDATFGQPERMNWEMPACPNSTRAHAISSYDPTSASAVAPCVLTAPVHRHGVSHSRSAASHVRFMPT